MKKEAMLYKKLSDNKVECDLCSHHCVIPESKYGFCGMRKNESGALYTFAYGDVITSHVDPIEKKPLYHFLPGTYAYSIATIGCNFRCGFCQNWQISQVSARDGASSTYELKPEEVVREAKKANCKSISYTYTEPTVFFEYAFDTAKIAKKAGLYNTFVTNGYMTKDALDKIKDYLDGCNVDLKSYSEKTYKEICKASLKPVLESIQHMKKLGMWVEVTTLVVPGLNDSDEELQKIAKFIKETGNEIPWHISRFHPDYRYKDAHPTPLDTLKKAEAIGKKAGLKYVYLGNVAENINTVCASCGSILIERSGYSILLKKIKKNTCANCGKEVEGIWQ